MSQKKPTAEVVRRKPRPDPRRQSKAKFKDDPTEPRRCHAATKAGTRCQNSVWGEDGFVCAMHGGKSPGRPAKHGGYSRVLGELKLRLYDHAIANENMLYDLRETLALSHVVLTQAIEKAEAGDVPKLRTRALALLREAFELGESDDPVGMAAKLRELERLLVDGVKDAEAVEHMRQAIEDMAKRQKDSWGIRLKAEQVVNERDLQLYSAAMIACAKRVFGGDGAARLAQEFISEGL